MSGAEYREQEKKEVRRNARFIQFPLALLALSDERFELMEAAMKYGVCYRARSITRRCKRDKEYFRMFKRWIPNPEPPDYDPTDQRHKAIAAAQAELGIVNSAAGHIECWRGVRKRLGETGVNPDKGTVPIRIPVHRAFSLRDGRIMEEWDALNGNDVRVLLAITSRIGRQDFVMMTGKKLRSGPRAQKTRGNGDSLESLGCCRPIKLHEASGNLQKERDSFPVCWDGADGVH